jgi:ParB-like chromosome segregation protein Spo0J
MGAERPHLLISEADMIKTISLKKLIPSPRNVRRTTDERADLQLKTDIEARGLLQNLVVRAATDDEAGHLVRSV